MKTTINSILKLVLVVTFSCTAAIADGDMTNGGKSCTGSACPSFAGNSGSQTNSVNSVNSDTDVIRFEESKDSVSKFVEEFLTQIGIM